MQVGQLGNGCSMGASDDQLEVSIFQQFTTKDTGVEPELGSPQGALDGDFPDACRAEVMTVGGVRD